LAIVVFETFQKNFQVDTRVPADAGNFSLDTRTAGLNELLARFGVAVHSFASVV